MYIEYGEWMMRGACDEREPRLGCGEDGADREAHPDGRPGEQQRQAALRDAGPAPHRRRRDHRGRDGRHEGRTASRSLVGRRRTAAATIL